MPPPLALEDGHPPDPPKPDLAPPATETSGPEAESEPPQRRNPMLKRSSSSFIRQAAATVSRVRAASVLNPPARLRTRRTNNWFINIIVPYIKNKSIWNVSLEMLLFLLLAGFIILLFEAPTEKEVENGLRSVLSKCRLYAETSNVSAVNAALSKMNITAGELESLGTIYGGAPFDFCELLEMYSIVEENNGYNWFNRWGYWSAVMFIATTVSTIGYGNLAPVTHGGKIFIIFSSIFGIPMAGFFFFTVAEEMRGWMLWWSHLTIKWWHGLRNKNQRQNSMRRQSTASSLIAEVSDFRLLVITIGLVIFFMFISSALTAYSMRKGWDFYESIWFTFVTFTTIGLGDLVPSWRDELIMPSSPFSNYAMPLMATICTMVGLSFTMAVVQSIGGVFEKEVVAKLSSSAGEGSKLRSINEEVEEWNGEEDEEDEEYRNKRGSSVFWVNQNPLNEVEGGGVGL